MSDGLCWTFHISPQDQTCEVTVHKSWSHTELMWSQYRPMTMHNRLIQQLIFPSELPHPLSNHRHVQDYEDFHWLNIACYEKANIGLALTRPARPMAMGLHQWADPATQLNWHVHRNKIGFVTGLMKPLKWPHLFKKHTGYVTEMNLCGHWNDSCRYITVMTLS